MEPFLKYPGTLRHSSRLVEAFLSDLVLTGQLIQGSLGSAVLGRYVPGRHAVQTPSAELRSALNPAGQDTQRFAYRSALLADELRLAPARQMHPAIESEASDRV